MNRKETILKLYDEYIESEINITDKYKELSKEFVKIREEFVKKLDNTEQERLDRIVDLLENMNTDNARNVFVQGYVWGTRLTMEALCSGEEK